MFRQMKKQTKRNDTCTNKHNQYSPNDVIRGALYQLTEHQDGNNQENETKTIQQKTH